MREREGKALAQLLAGQCDRMAQLAAAVRERAPDLLVVDDRSRTGATLALAREVLRDAAVVRTLAVNGKADHSLFDEPCFVFPWAPGATAC